jgi:hypothetical protein
LTPSPITPAVEGVKLDADLRPAEIEDEQLDQRRRAAEHADIDRADHAEDTQPRQPRRRAQRTAGQPQKRRQDRQLDRDPGRFEKKG